MEPNHLSFLIILNKLDEFIPKKFSKIEQMWSETELHFKKIECIKNKLILPYTTLEFCVT